jgi:hypothetical protein
MLPCVLLLLLLLLLRAGIGTSSNELPQEALEAGVSPTSSETHCVGRVMPH